MLFFFFPVLPKVRQQWNALASPDWVLIEPLRLLVCSAFCSLSLPLLVRSADGVGAGRAAFTSLNQPGGNSNQRHVEGRVQWGAPTYSPHHCGSVSAIVSCLWHSPCPFNPSKSLQFIVLSLRSLGASRWWHLGCDSPKISCLCCVDRLLLFGAQRLFRLMG